MGDLLLPVLPDVDRQVGAFHVFQRGTSPFQGGLHVPAFVLAIFCHFDMGIDVTVCGGGFPQADRFLEVAASLLQDGQTLHSHAEV